MELIKINEYEIDKSLSNEIIELENQLKALKEKKDALNEMILKEMESKGIIKVETPEIRINYIASSKKETFDSKKFREDNPDLYDEYIKISDVKSSIRIKVK